MNATSDPLGSFLINRFGEHYLPSVNQEVFSLVGSENFYRNHYKEMLWDEDKFYILSGTDSGLLVKYVLKHGVPSGTRYLFVDFPGILERLASERILPELPESIRLTTLEKWLETAGEMSISDYLYLDALEHVKSLASIDAIHQPYLDMLDTINNQMIQKRQQVTMEVGSRIFTMRMVENLPENRCASVLLKNSFAGKTAVLMAGGPSLLENLPWVIANRDRLVVLSVSRLAGLMHREGIVPDVIFSIDPHDIHFHASKEMLKHFGPGTLFVHMNHAHPGLVGQWRGRNAYMWSLFPWQTDLNGPNLIYPGITVSHQALGVAIDMGFTDVILLGFDLCFDEKGYTHVKGSLEASMGPFVEQTRYMVETNGGWQAETRRDFFASIPSLGTLAEHGVAMGRRFINPSAASAKIPFVQHLPLDQVIPAPLERPPHATLAACLPEDNRENREKHYRMVLAELDRVRDLVNQVKKLSIEALECNSRLFGRKGKPPAYKYKLRMDAIEKTLSEDLAEASLMVRRWHLPEFLKLIRPDKEKDWSEEEVEKAGQRYYEIYRNAAVAVLKWVDMTRMRVRSRLDEEKPVPDFRNLLQQWEQDKQYGRLMICLERHGLTLDKPPQARLVARLQKMAAAFQEQFSQEKNAYTEFARALINPIAVRAKAQSMFRFRHTEKLRTFRDAVSQSDMPYKDEFIFLMDGYLGELDDRMAESLAAYEKIKLDFLLEESMSRIVAWRLRQQDYPAALEALRKFSAAFPSHKPKYAQLLALLGDLPQAASQYEAYLAETRQDFDSMLKLARVYADMGDVEASRAQVDRVLAEDPDNQGAIHFLRSLQETTPSTIEGVSP
ncbi:MAG: DUF115 domain-containing protein [Magnetococcales bacterium]|nr:DUF115 domain-containing protein [Magnetococcales bacterium]